MDIPPPPERYGIGLHLHHKSSIYESLVTTWCKKTYKNVQISCLFRIQIDIIISKKMFGNAHLRLLHRKWLFCEIIRFQYGFLMVEKIIRFHMYSMILYFEIWLFFLIWEIHIEIWLFRRIIIFEGVGGDSHYIVC